MDQVNRDAPGSLGRTRNQTTMKMMKTITPSMTAIIHYRQLWKQILANRSYGPQAVGAVPPDEIAMPGV